jgi:NAD(P)-dependent dehydrogenase (short-subunit alcohol dehydrogenase family)
VAFVTGGASGIGFAISQALVRAGARVVLADWDAEALSTQVARLGPSALGLNLDVRDRPGWEKAKQTAEESFGPVDILVNNAGVAPDLNVLVDMAPETFDRLVAIMLTGIFNGVHTFGPSMRQRGRGHIVNTSSMAGLVATARQGAYTAAKFGVVGLTEVLRAEMEQHGVGVSVLCPGLVRTNLAWNRDRATGPRLPSPLDAGLDPGIVAAHVLEAIRQNDLYIITHGEYGPVVASRTAGLQQAFDRAPRRGGGEDLPGTPVAPT